MASPWLMLLGLPALALPFAAIAILDSGTPPSVIEQAIDVLPRPGAPAADMDKTPSIPPNALGPNGTALAASVALPLYANSARAAAARRPVRVDRQVGRTTEQDLYDAEFALLHPRYRAKDDLLVGKIALLFRTPIAADLNFKIFQEFCTDQPGSDSYGTSLMDLPINPDLLLSLAMLAQTASPDIGFCPRLAMLK